jgi:RND family efflux transporter MFP subunit
MSLFSPGKSLLVLTPALAGVLIVLSSCGRTEKVNAEPVAQDQVVTVGVAKVERHPLQRQLTVSSELVPFQEIDIYAKESGYVKQLLVDYGSHVKQGQLMAVLEIPELEAQLDQDRATVKSMQDQITNANNQLSRIEAQHKVLHLEYERLNNVSKSRPGLVAQQEVDDVQGRDLAAEAQVDAAKSNLEASRSNAMAASAKVAHDEAIYAYCRITAPFNGVVTQRYANYGTLMQAGTNSSTQALPLVKLSQENLYRLVIPVPESYVSYIKIGDPVAVQVPSLHKSFPGKVARFSSEVGDSTRTMHTEVDVENPTGELIPGLYANATLTLNRAGRALTVPMQAVDQSGERATVDIVNAANRIQSRDVTLGIEGESENEAEVLSGLEEGDRVVVSDRSGLKPGELVRPQVVAPSTYEGQGKA